MKKLRQHRRHSPDGLSTATAAADGICVAKMLDNVAFGEQRIVLRGQKPLALCDRRPCFGSLFPPLAALTFAASSIICAFGLGSLPHLARRIGT